MILRQFVACSRVASRALFSTDKLNAMCPAAAKLCSYLRRVIALFYADKADSYRLAQSGRIGGGVSAGAVMLLCFVLLLSPFHVSHISHIYH